MYGGAFSVPFILSCLKPIYYDPSFGKHLFTKDRNRWPMFVLMFFSYQPYTKPNTTLQYVHRDSNQPPTIKKTYQQESTDAFRTSHPTNPHLTKPHIRTRKHLTRAVINTPSNMNRPRQTRERTDKGTRSSRTILHSVKTLAQTSANDSYPW